MGDFEIKPLTPTTWDAFAALAEKHNGVWGGCWCTWFHSSFTEKRQSAETGRDMKHRLVEEGTAHAALVFEGDVAVGWCEYGTPEELPNIYHRAQYEKEADLVPDYRLTCFFIDRNHRRQGVSAAALDGALTLVARAGGGVVEGYPRDTQGRKRTASFLYNGTRTLFEKAGFEFVRSKGQFNCVMRRTVEPA
jgi:GNAT superfamily N-acetyltransferase